MRRQENMWFKLITVVLISALLVFVLSMFSACTSCQTDSSPQTDITTDDTAADSTDDTTDDTTTDITDDSTDDTTDDTTTDITDDTTADSTDDTTDDTTTDITDDTTADITDDTTDDTTADTTDDTTADISTPAQPIALTSPNGGEYWVTCLVAGATRNITWTSDGITGHVRIDLSRDGGNAWKTIMNSLNDGSQAWRVTGPATTMAKIRVVSTNDSTVFDESDDVFTIALPSITVVSPNGGENWVIGTTQTITWTSNYFGYANCLERILLSRDGGATWSTIITYTANDGSQAWNVIGPATTRAKIKVWEQDTPPFDVSDDVFTISKP